MKGKIGLKIRSILFSHWLLKLVSLILAFTLWFVVISTDDPVAEKRFQNVKVNLVNTSLLANNDQVYEILDNTDVLRTVTFDAPLSVRREIQSSDIIAEADLTNLTVTNTVEIKFSCPKYSDQVQNISGNIEYVRLNIEDRAEKWIDIYTNIIGEPGETYIVGNITLDQNRLNVQGPESAIQEIQRAEVDVDVTGMMRNSTTSGTIRLLGQDGNEVRRASVVRNLDTVVVKVEVWSTKEVPVVYEYTGVPAEGYLQTGEMETSVNQVRIAGPSQKLNGITEIKVEPEDLDITDAEADYEKVLHLSRYLPEGISFADKDFDDTARVVVKIEEIQERRITLQSENIQLINVPEGMTCEILGGSSSPLVVRGLSAYVSLLQAATLQGVVDVGAWMEEMDVTQPLEGAYSLPVTVSLLDQQELVSAPAITVSFTAIQDEGQQMEE